jgi:branched-chain amino acid transport system substrate-binding protein
VIRDDQGTPPKAIQTVQDLLDSEKVQALVGPANSGNALAWLHPAAKKIPVVVPIGTATEITTRYAKAAKLPVPHLDGRPGAGRLAGRICAQGIEGQEDRCAGRLHWLRPGGIKDATEILALHGVKPVAVEKYGPKDTDMTSQLNKIKAAGADTVIIYGIADGAAQVVRSMEKINYMPVTLGTWGNLSSLFPKMTGPKLAEHLIAAASTPRTPRIKPEPWVSVYAKLFGTDLLPLRRTGTTR